jgi:hypothetical protein
LFMKQMRPIMLGFLGCVFALATISPLSGQSQTGTSSDGLAKVVSIGGHARYYLPGDSTSHDLRTGMVIKPGTTIQTAAGMGNYVDLVLNNPHASEAPAASPSEIAHYTPKAEQDGVRIKENSVLVIDKLSITQTGADVVTDTELDLKAGTILGTVKKLSPTSKYEVKIPNGVAGIRGTIYEINATTGVVRVLNGSVMVAYVGSNGNVITQPVNAGQEFNTNTGAISTISAQDIHDLIVDSIGFRLYVNTPTTFIAPDHRIYFISTGQGTTQTASPGGGSGGPPSGGGGDEGGSLK